ncbi:plasmid mobilization protein [Mucilaginibacter paludis]|uniref:Mobilization protein n=1 Tax=Mucilaginibacter paludis DSM 18603 TaxID=714943 RepID=H1YBX2_9SPHI|nr:hypothetical protein [Mucilaginibacter paludis]EHQ27050.1 mobilization protein [Mucilaginibacter paludis DSM 18603]
MKDQKTNRNKWLHVRLTEEEYQAIQDRFKKTTCRKLSEYTRKVVLAKPITTTFRNASLDDFMAEMIRLRGELNSIGVNFNQSVHKLHMSDTAAQIQSWILKQEVEKKILFNKIDEIKLGIKKIAETWLQS